MKRRSGSPHSELIAWANGLRGDSMSFYDDDTTEAHERRITRCSSCRARIVFLLTDGGKKMPVDADTVDPEQEEFDPLKHTSHFVTCPNAAQHRGSRR